MVKYEPQRRRPMPRLHVLYAIFLKPIEIFHFRNREILVVRVDPAKHFIETLYRFNIYINICINSIEKMIKSSSGNKKKKMKKKTRVSMRINN